ncbi:type II toxin-antitoxin system RelE/ParE family toxin [Halostagnicola sp. A-GB9-2]|uniref:type II toxin-antitoxin system RelE/ParE family toxin n=1 Tax=Halostagnicola sp. A-GB9-2 TaxID=3048066 RepID=UPI0024C0596A|nr:type II toxin-antitoxin system RelE/ParE family toxin [Halostagnicola sp. A-GB9-2]MDJ1430743.1 type II toxin-antitoxin system RelE/ParE family toxin [Halostagnicola sp. A-GB9-2]
MSYAVLLGDQPREFLTTADEKSNRIVRNNLGKHFDEPDAQPGAGRGDREKLTIDGQEMYRMHIGRTYTAFCTVHEDDSKVRVREILPIDEAHDRYGH